MQIKDIKNLTPNFDVMAAQNNVSHADAEAFGSLFDMARYEVAETRSSHTQPVPQRRRDRLESYDTDRRRSLESASNRDARSRESLRSEKTKSEPVELPDNDQNPIVSAAETDSANNHIEQNPHSESTSPVEGENPSKADGTVPADDVNSGTNTSGTSEAAADSTSAGRAVLNDLVGQARALLTQHSVSPSPQETVSDQTGTDSSLPGNSQAAVPLHLRPTRGDGQMKAAAGQLPTEADTAQASSSKVTDQVMLQASNTGLSTTASSPNESPVEISSSEVDPLRDLMQDESETPSDEASQKDSSGLPSPEKSLSVQRIGKNVQNNPLPETIEQLERNLRPTPHTRTAGSDASLASELNPAETPTPAKIKSESSESSLTSGFRPWGVESLVRETGQGEMPKTSPLQDLVSAGKTETDRPVEMQQNIDRVVKTARSLIGRGSSTMQLRLDPPELGILRIEIRHSADGLNLQLQATNPRAQQLLQQHSNELRAALEAQGFSSSRIEVQLRLDLGDEQPLDGREQPFEQPERHFQNPSDRRHQPPFEHPFDNPPARFDGEEQSPATPSLTSETEIPARSPVSPDREPSAPPESQWYEMEFDRVDVKG